MRLDEQRNYMPMSRHEVLVQAEEAGVIFVALWFTDITGIVKSIVIPVDQLETVLDHGMHFDGSSLDGFARVAESDMVLIPDLATFTVLPWGDRDEMTARLICSVHTPQGEPFSGDPRNALARVIHQAEDMNFIYKTGMELEFFLFRRDAQGQPVLRTPQDNAAYFDIPDEGSQRIIRRMIAHLTSLGIQIDSSHSEIGAGQHEIGFQYNHALVSADQVLTSRVAMKAVANHHGLHCTFMPRPLADMPGSGMHTHQSLHDCQSGDNLFADSSHEYGLSEVARYFLAGQLAHARAMSAVLAPLVNSYKRLGTSFEAPVHITWAHINRSALIRVPSISAGNESHTRLELRCPDPSCNPYLASAVMLAAGLDGIRQRLPLPDPMEETLRVTAKVRPRVALTLPTSLEEALEALSTDDVILSALGTYISDRYLAAKKQEVASYNRQVTAWELETYLNRF